MLTKNIPFAKFEWHVFAYKSIFVKLYGVNMDQFWIPCPFYFAPLLAYLFLLFPQYFSPYFFDIFIPSFRPTIL